MKGNGIGSPDEILFEHFPDIAFGGSDFPAASGFLLSNSDF
jgi:hypothetical protein